MRHFPAARGLESAFLKREDLSHRLCGGNKVRGLEFLLADALEKRAGTLVTLSSAGSHHVCRTAWHARQLGMRTVAVVVPQPVATYVRANMLFGASAEARYVAASYATVLPKTAAQLLAPGNWKDGRPPYYIPAGGTSPRACVGHVSAALELKEQVDAGQTPSPDFIYVPLGSLGTAAGLLAGCRLAGLDAHIVGVVVSYRWYCTVGRTVRLARRTLRFLRRCDQTIPALDVERSRLSIVTTALGDGYAKFTQEAVSLARDLFDADGVALDGTYTSKALHGAMQFIRSRGASGGTHLFWQTYHPLATPAGAEDLIAALPPALRRYFSVEVQPLDRELPPVGADSR